MTGRMHKRREAFTIPLLIGREVWTPPARDPPPVGRARAGSMEGGGKAAPEGPVLGLLNVAGASSAIPRIKTAGANPFGSCHWRG